ncbi:type II toxin-antitoxin system HipA family toxin [Nesterenkonia sp. DZ6]|uniref:type II toxin-antitoxin system HipA family toxin n=1 Tax=Nesterenkonia sp. DZ6 TaxID=2901229 RepID=UPI001F4C581B|nr:type II toxin-antitoxin system HipA family toxin [Nesterenkonia sp. DZ6]MCH8560346.1 type II toxin-antitoxin system HipA family toxin [Nesterenkonia sp. DZ6]
MTKILNILLYNEHVADLTETRGGAHELRYLTDYSPAPVSLSLPSSVRGHSSRKVKPFLEGLLPDRADVREAMGSRYGVSGVNPFALLAHIGEDCAGAVQFVHPTRRDAVLQGSGEFHELSDRDISRRLREFRADVATSWVATQEHWSLGGAQSKFAVREENGQFHSVTGAEPTTHIIKPGIADLRDQALNEHISMTALRMAGLPAAETQFREFEDQSALVVKRYDRDRTADGRLVRIHQEDMCQALSVFPKDKYESNGGPRAVDIVTLLRETSGDHGPRNIKRFTDGLIANYLLGAPDAHAKNYGVMLAGDQVRLTPLYDVASGYPYDASTQTGLKFAAMKIGKESQFGRIEPKHWRRFAAETGLDADALCARVYELATILPDAVSDAIRSEAPIADELGQRLLDKLALMCEVAQNQYRDFNAIAVATGPTPGT